MERIKLIAFDVDGTLAQHKCRLEKENRLLLDELGKNYKIIINASNQIDSIWQQLGCYPTDIIGNYGMQYGVYLPDSNSLRYIFSNVMMPDIARTEKIIAEIQKSHGYPLSKNGNIKYHSSGCITYTVLGLNAPTEDKLSFDRDFSLRRRMLPELRNGFPDYTVFISGTTSFDIVPKPYDKKFALENYCRNYGYSHDEVVFCGDNYEADCNDYPLFDSNFRFIKVDDYRNLRSILENSGLI